MIDLSAITPTIDERMTIVGCSGSGKSTLGVRLLDAFEYVVAIDPIGFLGSAKSGAMAGKKQLDGYKLVSSPEELARYGAYHKRLQYRPKPEYQNWEAYDVVYHWLFERQNTMIYTDEAYRVMKGMRCPPWMDACVTAGRQRNVGMITVTQRPTHVDQRLFSEANHLVCFRLRRRVDRERLAETMGDLVVSHPAKGHDFYYMKDTDENLQYFELDLENS
jgi:hypothetical protein